MKKHIKINFMSNMQNTITDEMNAERVDEIKMDIQEFKECNFCGNINKSNLTPDGDGQCHYCGEMEMMDYEGDEPFEMMKKVHDFLYEQGKKL